MLQMNAIPYALYVLGHPSYKQTLQNSIDHIGRYTLLEVYCVKQQN